MMTVHRPDSEYLPASVNARLGLTKLVTARVAIILRTFWVRRQLSLIINK